MSRTSLVCVGIVLWALAAKGAVLASGGADFNGDGFADLAIGLPGRQVGSLDGAGAVIVLYGSSTGLSSSSAQLWHQDLPGVLDAAEADDHFGASLAWGDIDGDGFTDLCVGVPDEDYGAINDGAIHVFCGSSGGLTATGDQILDQDDLGTSLASEDGDRFGAAIAVADFGGDGFADVAVGLPDKDGSQPEEGAIAIVDGSATGLGGNGNQAFEGVVFVAVTERQQFGRALAAGDFNGDGRADLAIGIPGHDHNGSTDAGTVAVAYGSAGGITASGANIILQNSGLGKDAYEEMGFSLAAGDFDNSGKDDLAIGVPGQDVSGKDAAGAVITYRGTGQGLDLSGPKVWSQDTVVGSVAIKDKAEARDRFGWSLAAGDFNGDSRDDLAIGVPYEDNKNEDGITTNADAGQVHTINGSATGLTVVGNKKLHQGASGIGMATNEDFDHFAATLAAGDFSGDGRMDLAIGIPLEDNSNLDEGAVMTIHGSRTGIAKSTHKVHTQASLGIAGASAGDRMGAGVYGP